MDTFECKKKHFKFYAFLNLEPVQIKKMLIYSAAEEKALEGEQDGVAN